jgi:hypothetical protein
LQQQVKRIVIEKRVTIPSIKLENVGILVEIGFSKATTNDVSQQNETKKKTKRQ